MFGLKRLIKKLLLVYHGILFTVESITVDDQRNNPYGVCVAIARKYSVLYGELQALVSYYKLHYKFSQSSTKSFNSMPLRRRATTLNYSLCFLLLVLCSRSLL